LLEYYLPHAVFVRPAPFAKAMGVSKDGVAAVLAEMARAGQVTCAPGELYIWIAPSA
jgi:hypothetical protein